MIHKFISFRCALIMILPAMLFACGGGTGGGNNTAPTTDAKVAVFGDDWGPKLSNVLTARGLEVENIAGRPDSSSPQIAGDYVVWEENRSGNSDIYAYQLSTAQEFAVTTAAGYQVVPQVAGDYVVWVDGRNDNGNSNSDIYAYQLSTGQEFSVTTALGYQVVPQVAGDYVVWVDGRNDNGNSNSDIYAYQLSTGQEFAVTTAAGTQRNPQIAGDYVVWKDDRNGESNIYAYQLSTGQEFAVTTAASDPRDPQIAGDYVVWEDFRVGGFDIYAYQFSTGQEFAVTTAAGHQRLPQIAGDYVVWEDLGSGEFDIYGYQLSTGQEFAVTTVAGGQFSPQIAGDYIVWEDLRSGEFDIYGYQISTGQEFVVTTAAGIQRNPQISGGYVVWKDDRESDYSDVYLLAVGATEQNISTGKVTPTEFAARIGEFNVVLFGDGLSTTTALTVFDAADAARVSVLGIGTFDNNRPLGHILAADGRFGLSTNDDNGRAPMEIDVAAEGVTHSIFSGLDTSVALVLEDSAANEMDEQVYFTDPSAPDSPPDWTVLASMGANMRLAGAPAIVEFTTANGARVILDGSANTFDGYDYWTTARWDLLYNEVIYLLQ